jgi:hypothetical protein
MYTACRECTKGVSVTLTGVKTKTAAHGQTKDSLTARDHC